MDQTPKQDLLESMTVSNAYASNLLSAAKWGRFVAITGLIFLTLILISMTFAAATIADLFSQAVPGLPADGPSIVLTVIALVILIFGVLLFLMLRAYNNLKEAIETRNMHSFTTGWRNLKIYFTIYGVLSIVSIFNIIQSLTTLF